MFYFYGMKKQGLKNAEYIVVTGATQNNLKNVDVKLPLNKLIVITGVSGSAKIIAPRKMVVPGSLVEIIAVRLGPIKFTPITKR